LFDPILLAAVLTTALLGGALFRVLRSERRRAIFEPRLSTIAMTASSADMPVVSLRKPRPRRKALPIVLSTRLDLAFAATGNRIGPLHLVAAGTAAASTIGLVCAAASVQPALAIALGGAAAAGVPALLLRFAQSRYQRKFL
jgi:Flp pilus assembly protein TadB